MTALESRGHRGVAAAIAAGLLLVVAAPRSFAQDDECLVVVNDQTGALDDGATVCGEASNRRCAFELQISLNQEGCTPAELKGRKVRAKGHCGPVGRLFAPVPAGTDSARGAFTGVTVRTKKQGKREGRCTIRVVAKAKGSPKRKDLDRVQLVCKPNPGECS